MRALPRKITHFHIWHLHSIFIQSTIEPGGPVQFGWEKRAESAKRTWTIDSLAHQPVKLLPAACFIFNFFSRSFRGELFFSLFSLFRRASEFGIRTKWHVYESHIHIMWIIELWWIGNPSSFYLMQLWSERKKKEKWEKQETPTAWKESNCLSDWASERTNERKRVFSHSILLFFFFFFFIIASNRMYNEKSRRLFSFCV